LQNEYGYQALDAVLQMPSVFTEESDVRLELRFNTIANTGTISKGDTLFQWFSVTEDDGSNYSLSCTSTAMGNNTPFYVNNYFGHNSMSINDAANAGLGWKEQNRSDMVTAANYDNMMCSDMMCSDMYCTDMMCSNMYC
jgi:hypothetical protein